MTGENLIMQLQININKVHFKKKKNLYVYNYKEINTSFNNQ